MDEKEEDAGDTLDSLVDIMLNSEDDTSVKDAVLLTLPCYAKPHELLKIFLARITAEGYHEFKTCGHNSYNHVCKGCEPEYKIKKAERQLRILEIIDSYLNQDQVALDIAEDPEV